MANMSWALPGADPVRAQPPGDTPPSGTPSEQAPVLVPPSLVTFVEAVYPPEAEAQRLEGAVELAITLDAEGRVTDVTVTAPAGHGFDEAAVAAAKQFVFEPARKGDRAVPSRIGYRYVFELKPEPAEEPAVPAADSSDASSPGASGPNDATSSPAESAPPAVEISEGFEARAVVDPPPREPTRRTLTKEVLTRIPGTRGDALRAVELLPGVARPTFGVGVLIVRGSSPGDTGIFLDGSPIPLLYHFGGLTSFMNSRLLERIDFYPGNFSARYGRQLGGVLEVSAREGASDKLHGVLDLNILDASILVEGPVTDEWSIAFAARRSYIDFFFKEVVPKDFFDVVTAPIYADYQLLSTWRPTDRDRVSFNVYGSSDQLELIFSEPLDGDPAVSGDFDQSTQFHRGQLEWHRAMSKDVDQDLMLSFGPTLFNVSLGDALRLDATFWQFYGRAEWTGRVSRAFTLRGGFDGFFAPFDLAYVGPPAQQSEGNPDAGMPLSTRPTAAVDTDGLAFRPSVYLEASTRVIEPLLLITGLRFDWYQEIERIALNPRTSAILSVTDDTRVKGGLGVFSQPPTFAESSRTLGNPNLGPEHSLHGSLGVEHDWLPGFTTGLEGYYKHLWNLVVGTPNGADPRFENDGLGRIYGVELSARLEPRGRPFFGYVSYTLSRSQRRDHPGDAWRLFDFDQTHILTLAGVYQLGKGWEAGATFRLVSGNPNTPVSGSYFREDKGVYVPLYGRTNSIRSSMFHRLDVRVEKKWTFADWSLAAYIDVQNAYNRQNQEGLIYNFNYSDSAVLPGLPILPSIGLRGEL